MRFLTLFKKTVVENLRDWKILSLTLTFAPFFVLLMHFYMASATKTFALVVVNRDQGAVSSSGVVFNSGQFLLEELKRVCYPDGSRVMEISFETDLAVARKKVQEKAADLAVEIPENFSGSLLAAKEGRPGTRALVRSIGDAGNPKYILAAAYCDYAAFSFAALFTGQHGPLDVQPETIGRSRSLDDFERYLPALLALSLMMLMFTAAASIIKEKDKGTLVRLQLSNMRIYEFIGAVSVSQLLIGLLALGLTLLSAMAIGYRTTGSLVDLLVVGALSSLAVVAISLLVAAWLRSIFDLMTVGCFPFFILMFFSGGMFPLPPLVIFRLGGRAIQVIDILPTTHSITAMSKILNEGVRLGGLGFEMAAMAALTALYFWAGMSLFRRRHLRAR